MKTDPNVLRPVSLVRATIAYCVVMFGLLAAFHFTRAVFTDRSLGETFSGPWNALTDQPLLFALMYLGMLSSVVRNEQRRREGKL